MTQQKLSLRYTLSQLSGTYQTRPANKLLSLPLLQTLMTGSLLAIVFTGFLALVQFASHAFPDVDSYYHSRLAQLMGTQGLLPSFPYLPLSILNAREYYDHHFLFHVALIPFTWIDIRLGAKWAAVIFAALAFLTIWRLMERQRVPHAAIWALGLLAVSEAFLFRLSQVRAQSLSLAFLVLGLHWMFTGKYSRLLPLGFLFVWFYDAFPLLGVMTVIYMIAVLITEHRLELRPILYAGVGIALGMLINPYFPDNIVFTFRHILPKVMEATSTSVGNEWYPYDTGQLLQNSFLALAALVAGALALGLRERRMESSTATIFLVTLLFGFLLFQSRRYVEYYPPFALLFAALAWAPILTGKPSEPEPPAGHNPGSVIMSGLRRWLPAAVLIIIFSAGGWYNLQRAHDSVARAKSFETYAGASTWLEHNTPAGALIFQTDWDDFPRLFYHNTHNNYLVGLDPTYMQLYDADLYQEWVSITRGNVENPAQTIFSRFGARYIHTDLFHDDFIRVAEGDPNLREMYRDGDSIIFQVVGLN
jgi:hypothetical protein